MGLQGGFGGFRQHFSFPLPSQLRGIVVESAAALFHSALQTLGSEYCVARWGTPAERGGQRQRQRHNEVMAAQLQLSTRRSRGRENTSSDCG